MVHYITGKETKNAINIVGLVWFGRGEAERITWKGLGGGGDGWEDRTGGYRVPYQEAISPLMPAALLPVIGHL